MIESLVRMSVRAVPWSIRTRIHAIPLLGRLQRILVARHLNGREFVHTVDAGPAAGLRYPVLLPDDKSIWTGTYELEMAGRLAAAVRPGSACLDIGAWHGFFSGVMALAGAGRVMAVEPSPINTARVRLMQGLNPGLPIELIEAAVGARVGTAPFELGVDSSMSRILDADPSIAPGACAGVVVRVTTLDDLVETAGLEDVAVVKIDVEGAEVSVLRGAGRLLAERRPALFIETHSPALAGECTRILSANGYEVLPLARAGPERGVGHLQATVRGCR